MFKVIKARKWALAAVLAAVAAVLPAAGASAVAQAASTGQPPGTSTIEWDSSGLCLFASFPQVKLEPCNPSDPREQWVFTPGHKFRLHGTRDYIVPGTSVTLLGSWAQAPPFDYVNHALAAEGDWLTHCPGDGPSPYLVTPMEPGCQAWYVFTFLGP